MIFRSGFHEFRVWLTVGLALTVIMAVLGQEWPMLAFFGALAVRMMVLYWWPQ